MMVKHKLQYLIQYAKFIQMMNMYALSKLTEERLTSFSVALSIWMVLSRSIWSAHEFQFVSSLP